MGQMNVIRVARAYITSRLESIQIPEISWETITLMLLNVSEMIKRFQKKKKIILLKQVSRSSSF